MKFSDLQKYKHDTVGKFQILKELIESITDENLKTDESMEILTAADELYSQMSKTSHEFLSKLQS